MSDETAPAAPVSATDAPGLEPCEAAYREYASLPTSGERRPTPESRAFRAGYEAARTDAKAALTTQEPP